LTPKNFYLRGDFDMSKVEIFAKNLEVNERITEYVNKKVMKLDRFLSEIDDVRVDLNFIKSARSSQDRQVAQITLRGKGIVLRTEERADDLFAAFDAAIDKMQRKIERYKGKRNRGRGDGRSAADVIPVTEVSEEGLEETDQPVIVRRKTFTLVPMDELEAMEQMSLLGHENFFIFYNANTHKINVLYRRRDGSLGLIEPEIG
jgi:putative sigma-54 modulation protein